MEVKCKSEFIIIYNVACLKVDVFTLNIRTGFVRFINKGFN